jgi:hypothetical protein
MPGAGGAPPDAAAKEGSAQQRKGQLGVYFGLGSKMEIPAEITVHQP